MSETLENGTNYTLRWESLVTSTSPQAPIGKSYYGGTLGTEICRNLPDPPLGSMVSWKYIGSQDLQQASITFFNASKYLGISFSVVPPDNLLDLTTPVNVSSFFLTGPYNWAVHDKTGFEGGLTCLNTVASSSGDYGARGVEYLSSYLTVGSIRLGCPGDGDVVTTTRRPGGGGTSIPILSSISLTLSLAMVLLL